MAPEGPEDRIDDLLDAVFARPDDDLALASARARSRRRWLRQQAAECSTMAGVLLTLAEREAQLTVRSRRWTHRGRLRRVTSTLTVIEGAEGAVLVPTSSINVVDCDADIADDRTPGGGPDLAAVLGWLVGERPALRLLLDDASEVSGSLWGVGKDAVTVRRGDSFVTVRLSAVEACVLPSGETPR